MTSVVLGLGSNKAWQDMPSVRVLARAVKELGALLFDMRWSSVYRTAPLYLTEQSAFCNMVVTGFVPDGFSPHDLLARIHQIEASLGRNRATEVRNGPRTIDIDIEFFGDEQIHVSDPKNPMNDLDIPHPRLAERAFVLVPLLEILGESADTRDSAYSARTEEVVRMLDACGSDGVEKMLDAESFAHLR